MACAISAHAHDVRELFALDTIVEKLLRADLSVDVASEEESQAAVAAILREGAGGKGAELFFIRRAESATDPWSGHVAFPGGRRDAEDHSLLATAIRETREEVGIDLHDAELVARLPNVPVYIKTKRGNLEVTTFVFAVRGPAEATPNEEVASTMWIPVQSLASGEGRGTYSFTWEERSYDLPCVRLKPDNHVLWGLTHRMTEMILEALM